MGSALFLADLPEGVLVGFILVVLVWWPQGRGFGTSSLSIRCEYVFF